MGLRAIGNRKSEIGNPPLLGLALCALALGCSGPAGHYLGRRGADLADCVEGTVGVGVGAYVRVKATDFLVLGLGVAEPFRVGWRGRYAGGWGTVKQEELVAGFPLIWNYEGPLEERGFDFPEARHALATVKTWGPCFTWRTYPPDQAPGLGGHIAERCWLGFDGAMGLSLRLGLNPAELLDFLVGWLGWDLLGDDEAVGKKGEGEP